jgi:SSS family solute:Na+ symporter
MEVTVNVPLLIILSSLFVAIMGFLAWLGYKQTKSSADFLLAGQNVHPYLMAISYGAAFISSSAIIGFGGLAGKFGMQMLWVVFLNIAIGIILAFLVFGKRMRKIGANLEAQTFPDFMAKRYGSNFARWFSALFIFIFMPLYAAAVLIGASRFMEITFNIEFIIAIVIYTAIVAIYVITGGLKGVVYADAFLGTIMIGAGIYLLLSVYMNLGGVSSAHVQLAELNKYIPEALAKGGHQGLAAFPAFNSDIWWTSISSFMMAIGLGVLAQPQLLVRFMTVKSGKELNRAVGIGSLFILLVVGSAYITGALSNVYFFKDSGQLAIQAANNNPDLIMAMFMNNAKFMPQWFVYVFLLSLMSAAISTSAAQFHTLGSSLGKDIVEDGVIRKANTSLMLVWKRIGTFIAIVIVFLLSLWLANMESHGSGVVGVLTAFFFSLCSATFLPTIIGSLFWRGTTKAGVVSSMVVGLVVSVVYAVFFNGKIASGFGLTPALGKPWIFIDAGAIGLPFSLITLFVVSKFTNKLPQELVDKCFK